VVHGPARRRDRARPDLPAHLAVRRAPRRARRAGELLPDPRRRAAGRRHARRGRHAAGVRQRLPPPRRARRDRSGAARRGTLQCPDHAWTYGLDGALRAAPRSDLEPCFDRDALGLLPVAVDTWGPFVFVNSDPEAEPLAAALGDLPEVVAAHGLDIDALAFRRRYPYELNANWKIAVENYLECYHCAVNHPGFVDAVDGRALRLETGPTRLSQFAPVHPRAVASREPYDVRGELAMSQFHILLPAMKFNVSPGRPNLSIGPLWPVAPDRCTGWLDYFFAPGVSEDWVAEFTAWDFQVGAEDIALVEGVQAGAASGAVADGRLLEITEGLIAAFQAYVRARVEPEL
jgi:choline monooxygenase